MQHGKIEAKALEPGELSAVRQTAKRADLLAYIADMISELSTLAASSRCETLGALLEVAKREAEIQASRH